MSEREYGALRSAPASIRMARLPEGNPPNKFLIP